MTTYYFFSKTDKKKESISKTKTDSLIEAIEHFAKVKQLPIDKFLQLYEVTNEDNSRTKG